MSTASERSGSRAGEAKPSPGQEKPKREARPRDAAATRDALIDAARELFEEHGYDGATVREIGERARADPALIARYFGNKEGLYLAVLAREAQQPAEGEATPSQFAEALLSRWDERGSSPFARALASPSLTDEVREQVATVLDNRVLPRLLEGLRKAGTENPDLKAELLVALLLGVAITRANQTLPALSELSRDELLTELAPLVTALSQPATNPPLARSKPAPNPPTSTE